jgi:hypothetical protein
VAGVPIGLSYTTAGIKINIARNTRMTVNKGNWKRCGRKRPWSRLNCSPSIFIDEMEKVISKEINF